MKTARVLIVDDNAAVRQDLRTVLGLSGRIEVVGEAANGIEAVRLLEQIAPDAVLLDLEMPGLDGYETARRIKSRRACVVIVLSVHDDASARSQARQAGVDAFIGKGAGLEDMLETIFVNLSS
jgi:DNA-binding NarL/FixJ family response regulator